MAACSGYHVEMCLPNRAEFVAVARLAVAAIASRMDFDVNAIEDIKVALGEAYTNAIEHGCPSSDGTEMITLHCELATDALIITVHDPGDGFDPTTATRQHRHGTVTLTERGLGMLLIEALMDEVAFCSDPGIGTQVRMVKRREAKKAEER